MTVHELEKRVLALEKLVAHLRETRLDSGSGSRFDWEATVEKFKNDEHVLAVLRDAMREREKERKAVQNRSGKARGNKS